MIENNIPPPQIAGAAAALSPETAEFQRNLSERYERKSSNTIFVGLGIVLFLVGGTIIYLQHFSEQKLPPKALPASTRALESPAPIIIQLTPDDLRVSAIILGHPRLAVINGHSLGEGDTFTVHTPNRSIAVQLRVLKIADGRIELSDGAQVITAKLSLPKVNNQDL